MRRFHALLIAAGLAATPVIAAAAPPAHAKAGPPIAVEKFEYSTSKGRLGVMVLGLTPELRAYFGSAPDRGVLVGHVEPGSAAANAGLIVGDLVVEVHGKPIDGAGDVLAALADVKRGEHAEVAVLRDHQPVELDVTMTTDPTSFDRAGARRWMQEMMKQFGHQPPFDDWDWPMLEPPSPSPAPNTPTKST